MTDPVKTLEISATDLLIRHSDVRSLLLSLISYVECSRHNAALIHELTGDDARTLMMEAQTLCRAMGTQINLSNDVLKMARRAIELIDGAAADQVPAAATAPAARGH